MDDSTAVLIVGGSLNGLTMAMLLARRRVPCLVLERHPQTSIQYKFRGISPRSMEIYRSAGIEAEIRDRDLIDDRSASVARMKHLADSEVSWQWMPPSDTSDISSTTAATCDQDRLEPILRAHAERQGADVRFNTELVSFAQVRSSWPAMTRLPAIDRPPARALDEALQAIGGRYGAHTTDFVAMQLEYPTAPRRAVRRSANAFDRTSITRSLR